MQAEPYPASSPLAGGSLDHDARSGLRRPTAAPRQDCASRLSLAGGADGAAPCAAPVGGADGPRVAGVKPASVAGVVRDRPDREAVTDGVSTRQNLASFGVALAFAAAVLLSAGALAELIAGTFFGYGGLA